MALPKTNINDFPMPILDRTSLNPSDKAHLLAKSSICQAYGDISQVSLEFNVSGKTVYKARDDGLEILNAAVAGCEAGKAVTVDSCQLKRTVIALSIGGINAIRAIEADILV